MVGKYTHVRDAYKSIVEAFVHAGAANRARVRVRWVEAGDVETRGAAELLAEVDGVLVPGGFGERGIEGKIEAARYARERGIPYFGLCLGHAGARRSSSRATWWAGRRPTPASSTRTPHRR